MITLLLLCLFTQIHTTGIEKNRDEIVTTVFSMDEENRNQIVTRRFLPADEENRNQIVPTDEEELIESLNVMLKARCRDSNLYDPMVNVFLDIFDNTDDERRSYLVNMIMKGYDRIEPELEEMGVVMPPLDQFDLPPELDRHEFREFILESQGQPLSPLKQLILGALGEGQFFDQDESEDDLTPVFPAPLIAPLVPQVLYQYRQAGQVEQGNKSPLAPEAQENRRRQAEDSPEGQPPRQRRRFNLEDEPVNQPRYHHDDENGPDGGGVTA